MKPKFSTPTHVIQMVKDLPVTVSGPTSGGGEDTYEFTVNDLFGLPFSSAISGVSQEHNSHPLVLLVLSFALSSSPGPVTSVTPILIDDAAAEHALSKTGLSGIYRQEGSPGSMDYLQRFVWSNVETNSPSGAYIAPFTIAGVKVKMHGSTGMTEPVNVVLEDLIITSPRHHYL